MNENHFDTFLGGNKAKNKLKNNKKKDKKNKEKKSKDESKKKKEDEEERKRNAEKKKAEEKAKREKEQKEKEQKAKDLEREKEKQRWREEEERRRAKEKEEQQQQNAKRPGTSINPRPQTAASKDTFKENFVRWVCNGNPDYGQAGKLLFGYHIPIQGMQQHPDIDIKVSEPEGEETPNKVPKTRK